MPVSPVTASAIAAATWLLVFEPLKLDTNFTTLLPDDLPCVVESRRVSKLVGSTDHLIIAIESPVAEDNAIAARIASILEATGWFRDVAVRVEDCIACRLCELRCPDLAIEVEVDP